MKVFNCVYCGECCIMAEGNYYKISPRRYLCRKCYIKLFVKKEATI